jgi:hypothetical protein
MQSTSPYTPALAHTLPRTHSITFTPSQQHDSARHGSLYPHSTSRYYYPLGFYIYLQLDNFSTLE